MQHLLDLSLSLGKLASPMPVSLVPTPRAPFQEITPPLSPDQAAQEAARCLFCYDAPCIAACPTEIDIPRFIQRISTGDTVGAAETILSANILGGSCARVCPVEVLCEGSCVEKTLTRRPVSIGRLQRFATDHVLSRGLEVLRAGAATGKSVGVIGAGPAGLGAAAELRKLGHAVTIYDERAWGGGLNTYAMAEYKQTAALAIAEVEQVQRLGAELKQGVRIGSGPGELSIDALLAKRTSSSSSAWAWARPASWGSPATTRGTCARRWPGSRSLRWRRRRWRGSTASQR